MILEPDQQKETTKKKKTKQSDSLLTIVEGLADSMDDMKELNRQKFSSDQELSKVSKGIETTLAQLTTSIGALSKRGSATIDTSPLSRLVQQAAQQNKDLIAAVTAAMEKTSPADHGRLLRELVATIDKSNKAMLATYLGQIEKTVQTLAEAIASRPLKWKHVPHRRGGQLDHVISTAEE